MNAAELLIGLLLALCTATALADITFSPGERDGRGWRAPIVKVTRSIKIDDVDLFIEAAARARKNAREIGMTYNKPAPFILDLDSAGGSVKASILIGRLVRDINPLYVRVPKSSVCNSSCVYILAGGVSRHVEGSVGVHRPYWDEDTDYTVDGQKRKLSDIEVAIKSYLGEVNISAQFYDLMFRVPPEKMKHLTNDELQYFGLNENDPYFEDANTAQSASYLGLTKSEYFRFTNEVNTTCVESELDERADCRTKILYRYVNSPAN